MKLEAGVGITEAAGVKQSKYTCGPPLLINEFDVYPKYFSNSIATQ